MNFAQLAADIATPSWGFSYQYTLPADCLRFLSIEARKVDYQLEGDKILVDDEGPLNIRYIARVADTSRYSPTFVAALAARWAFEICNVVESRVTPDQLAVLALTLAQWPLMARFVRAPVDQALLLSAFGVPLYVSGMMVSAFGLRHLHSLGVT